MSIQSVNSVNFTGSKARTKQGNEYDKSSAGKYIGMGLGAVVGAGCTGYKVKKGLSSSSELKRFLINFNNSLLNSFSDISNISRKEFRELRKKSIKIGIKAAPVIIGAAGLLAGLGLGAIVDGIINNVRSKKADKSA